MRRRAGQEFHSLMSEAQRRRRRLASTLAVLGGWRRSPPIRSLIAQVSCGVVVAITPHAGQVASREALWLRRPSRVLPRRNLGEARAGSRRLRECECV